MYIYYIHTYMHTCIHVYTVQHNIQYIHSTNTATADTGDKGRRTLCVYERSKWILVVIK